MTETGYAAFLAALAFIGYTYLGYPLVLRLLSLVRGRGPSWPNDPQEWPDVTITVPVYNEENHIADLLENLLALDYPPERRHILIVSDGSTDRTDDIVSRFEARDIVLLRQPERAGKTAAENAAVPRLRGGIVVNTDASIRFPSRALKHLVAPFQDPRIGLTSGRDVSVTRSQRDDNVGESRYVGYEMWIRDLETRTSGIVGASGCFYAIRTDLHGIAVPDSLSRDFAAALKCREHGLRAISVPEAVCYVPRTSSLKAEYRRKVRTIARGMDTLAFKRHLLNPCEHGLFAWKLLSHKVCRWAAPWAAFVGFLGLLALAPTRSWAFILAGAGLLILLLGTIGWYLGDGRSLPRTLQVPGFVLMGNVAAMHAFLLAISGDRNAVWEPTRREPLHVVD